MRLLVVGLTHTHAAWALRAAAEGQVDLVAVVEPDDAVWHRYRDQFHLADGLRFATVADAADHTHPEAASAMGTTASHREVAARLAPYRIPLMVEKPLALDLADALELAAVAGAPVVTHYETSWYPALRTAADIVASREFGDLRRMEFRTGHSGPVARNCPPEFLAWCADPSQSGGGALMDFGCYGAAISLWLTGRSPDQVRAVATQVHPETYPHAEDDATVVAQWDGGPVAVIQGSWVWPHDLKVASLHLDSARLDIGRWGDLLLHPSDGAPLPVACPDNPPHLRGMWPYLAHVTAGGITDPLSDLSLNLEVMRLLDEARTNAGLPLR